MLNANNRAITINVDFDNPGSWRAGSSIDGLIYLQDIPNAQFLPEQAVVNRRAGKVIFAIREKDHTAKAIPVQTGYYENGMIEIKSKLQKNLLIVNDGAAYLEDGTPVRITKGSKK
jgi:multidrug efflux pump subunit AcrA (membrane-fusion protein)